MYGTCHRVLESLQLGSAFSLGSFLHQACCTMGNFELYEVSKRTQRIVLSRTILFQIDPYFCIIIPTLLPSHGRTLDIGTWYSLSNHAVLEFISLLKDYILVPYSSIGPGNYRQKWFCSFTSLWLIIKSDFLHELKKVPHLSRIKSVSPFDVKC